MDLAEQIATERRARLAAERLLDQMKSELGDANRRLALHARKLSGEIVTSREEIGRVLSEAEMLKSEVSHARLDLERAESAMVIAERRLWDSLETIRDGFAVFDRDNVLIAANRAYLSIFDGLDMVRPGISMAEIVELLADEGLVDTGGLRSAEWQRRMLQRYEDSRIDHAVLKLWNGQYIQIIDRRTRTGDIVTLALNITEQTMREEQLREARERAEAANRAKSAFLANMSHEIRTPMNGVIAMAEMLAETRLDDEQRSFLDTIRSSGEALLVIINDVLDYSKIEADKISFKSQPFDLERCIADVVMLLQPGALEKGLQVAVDYDLFMPTTYLGDAGRVRQVLTNLVGNAIKFTEKGHVLIRVVGLPEEEGGAYRVHVTVEDTGIGIPADKLDLVFQEFQQVESDRDRTHDGTGLGLAITRKLVRAMGGDVWVDSREGEGSGFGFFLPLDAVDEIEAEDVTAPQWIDRAIVLDRPGMNSLVLQKQLGLLGLKAIGADRIEQIVAERPTARDVVFIGQGSVDGDIFAASAALRGQFGPAGLFLLAGSPARAPASNMPFDRILQRPVLRGELMGSLRALAPQQETAPRRSRPGEDDSDGWQAHSAPPPPYLVAADPVPEVPVLPVHTEERRLMRVLAAEDNRTNRFVFDKMVKSLEIDLLFAENGLEAVEAYKVFAPDIVFTDISMPKMDGKEATRRIREIEAAQGLPRCPVVAITAHAMEGDAEEILAAGIDHYLTKPLKKQEIIGQILAAQPLDARPALPEPEIRDEPGLRATAAE